MEQAPKYLFIRELDLFKSLDDSYIQQISNQSNFESFKRGKFIFDVGDPLSYVYIIRKGSIKVGLNTASEKILIKEIAQENEILGENIFTGQANRRQFAEALSQSEVLKIPVSYFKALLEKNPHLCHELTKIFIEKLANLETRMNNFIFKKAQKRIYDFLRNTAILKGIKIGIDEILINHGLSHKEIANITDTSRQTVARVLGELKRQEIIHFSARKPHKILIRNMVRLA